MNKQVQFLNMFPNYTPPEELKELLSQAVIVAADLDPENRSLEVVIHCDRYIPLRVLQEVSREICRCYRLKNLGLQATHPREELHRVEPVLFDHITRMDMCVKCRIPISGAMFRRSLYDICGGMREDIDADEDWAMWLRYLGRARRPQQHAPDISRALSACLYPADPVAAAQRS